MSGSNSLMLAIDTATEVAGIALYEGDRGSELIWNAGRNQTVVLLAQIQHLLALNGRDLNDVGALATAIGPGAFNGLRVGLSTAKGLGYGRSLPVFGVDTLEATAYPHRAAGMPIRAFAPAGRGRIVLCDFRHQNSRWMRVGEMQNRPFDELLEGLSEQTIVTGEVPTGHEIERLQSRYAEIPRPALRVRRPACLAEIAWRRWVDGETDDIAALEPLYIHSVRNSA